MGPSSLSFVFPPSQDMISMCRVRACLLLGQSDMAEGVDAERGCPANSNPRHLQLQRGVFSSVPNQTVKQTVQGASLQILEVLKAVVIYSAKSSFRQLSQTLQVWQQRADISRRQAMSKCSNLIQEVRKQRRITHARGKWLAQKETTAQTNQPNKTPTASKQSIPLLLLTLPNTSSSGLRNELLHPQVSVSLAVSTQRISQEAMLC